MRIEDWVPVFETTFRTLGIPTPIAVIAANAVPRIVNIVQSAISGGHDAEAELNAALDGLEAGFLAAGEKKFGPG